MSDWSHLLLRQTGALSKTIDRGSRGIATVLNALVFNIFPTVGLLFFLIITFMAFQCIYLIDIWTELGVRHSGVEVWTTVLSCGFRSGGDVRSLHPEHHVVENSVQAQHEQVRAFKARNEVYVTHWLPSRAENEAGNRAVDSLINYETVKYFNNEDFEAKEYNKCLKKYEEAAMKTSTSLALLNFGQNAIFRWVDPSTAARPYRCFVVTWSATWFPRVYATWTKSHVKTNRMSDYVKICKKFLKFWYL